MKTLQEHNNAFLEVRHKVGDLDAGVLCDKCGTEMKYIDVNINLLSLPPKKTVKCPNCSYKGFKNV